MNGTDNKEKERIVFKPDEEDKIPIQNGKKFPLLLRATEGLVKFTPDRTRHIENEE